MMNIVKKYPLQMMSGVAVVVSCVAALTLYPSQPANDQSVKSMATHNQTTEMQPLASQVKENTILKKTEDGNANQFTNEVSWNAADFAPSLSGTDIDGDLEQDENGNLVIDLAIKDLFDYFLSAVGEVPLEDAIAQIEQLANQKLSPGAAGEVTALLDNYLAYQHALQDLMDVPLQAQRQNDYAYYSDVMAKTFEQIKQLRRTFFSPEVADAFFAMEEQFSEYAVSAMRIRADQSLSEAEKQKKIEALEDLMPEQMRVAREEAKLTAEIANTAREMFDKGYDNDEISSLLAQRYDSETVDEMMAFYQREKSWQHRIDQFMDMKANIDHTELDSKQKELQLQGLREQYFSQEEMVRVLSHEAIVRKQNQHQG